MHAEQYYFCSPFSLIIQNQTNSICRSEVWTDLLVWASGLPHYLARIHRKVGSEEGSEHSDRSVCMGMVGWLGHAVCFWRWPLSRSTVRGCLTVDSGDHGGIRCPIAKITPNQSNMLKTRISRYRVQSSAGKIGRTLRAMSTTRLPWHHEMLLSTKGQARDLQIPFSSDVDEDMACPRSFLDIIYPYSTRINLLVSLRRNTPKRGTLSA